MLGIPIATWISLAVTYGPAAVQFIQSLDPLLHQLIVAAAPLAQQIKANFNTSHDDSITHAVNAMSTGVTNEQGLQAWWDRQNATG